MVAAAAKKKQDAQPDVPSKEPLSKQTLTRRQKEVLDELGKERLTAMYRTMFLIRSFEQRCEQMYQQKKIGGFLHLYMGQEALAVGMLGAARPDDYVVTSYRDHGIALALGLSPNPLMAEMFGKVSGVSRGKGGSMHFYSKEKNLLGGHGIVGGQIPVGLGAAFRAKYLKTENVSLTFLGDGAVAQGTFHESLNIAALWSLPAIFVIENNQYGMGTSASRALSVADQTLRAPGYGMDGMLVDGMNLLDCYGAMADVLKARRKHPAPALIEAKTYRYRGHSISDPGRYRSKEEMQHYQHLDPIQQIKRLMDELGWMGEDAAKDLEREVRQEVLESVEFAEQSAFPDLEERDLHVYAD